MLQQHVNASAQQHAESAAVLSTLGQRADSVDGQLEDILAAQTSIADAVSALAPKPTPTPAATTTTMATTTTTSMTTTPTTTPTTTTERPTTCPTGYTAVESEARTACYKVTRLFTESKLTTWSDLSNNCTSQGASMAGFRTEEELQWLIHNIHGDFWVNLVEDGAGWTMAGGGTEQWKEQWCPGEPETDGKYGWISRGRRCLDSQREAHNLWVKDSVCQV